MKNDNMEIKPIAYIHTDFKEKFGIPRQSGRVDTLKGKVVFEPEYSSPEAFRGLESFSHIWLIFDFSAAHTEIFSPTVRPPRLGGNKRVGVFATRSPYRPNSLGLSCVKLEKIEFSALRQACLTVSGVDLLDGTPIYDIKPYIPYADMKSDAKGSFSDEFSNYKLTVDFPLNLLTLIPEEKRNAVIGCLEDDPRPSYHNDTREYTMLFANYDISFTVKDNILTVISVKMQKELKNGTENKEQK